MEKEIINWNIRAFNNLTSFVDLVHRAEIQQKPISYDYRLRDFYFSPSLDIFGKYPLIKDLKIVKHFQKMHHK